MKFIEIEEEAVLFGLLIFEGSNTILELLSCLDRDKNEEKINNKNLDESGNLIKINLAYNLH